MKNLIFAFGIVMLFAQCNAEKELLTPTESSTTKEFVKNPEATHYVVMQLAPSADIEGKKNNVKQFHTNNNYAKLRVSNIFISNEKGETPVLVIRRFENFSKAKGYIENFEKQIATAKGEKLFAFSQENYRKLLRERDLQGYENFYKTINSGE
ncbi:MAG: hypothetical protein AAF573_18215 [Bacteroidota bacterium]